jgi:hypothetical protein
VAQVPAVNIWEAEEVADELSVFDLDTETLHEKVIGRAVRVARRVDPLAPRGATGRRMHDECVAGLRGHLIPKDWELREEDGVARTVHVARSLAIVCARGNEFTGLKDSDSKVTSAWPKGEAAFAHARVDQLVGLESINSFGFPNVAALRTVEWDLWYLLYRQAGNEVRAELSAPRYLDSSGFPKGWRKRIIVEPYSDGDEFDFDLEGDTDPMPDVPVVEL